jgi:hypothetical protein
MTGTKLDAAKEQIRRVAALLRGSGHPADEASAVMLEEGLSSMNGRFETKEALFKIGEHCHPKALGDRFMPGLTLFEWQKELEVLEGRCAEAFNELERSGP